MNDLLKRAKEIRDEVRIGRNTASRVGGLLVDIVGQLGDGGGSCVFTDLGGIPNDEFDNITKQGYYLYARQAGTGDIKGILVVSNDGNIRQVRYEFDGTYVRSYTDEGWEEWTDLFILKLRKHIDNDTIYWDGVKKVIKSKGGGEMFTITVDMDETSGVRGEILPAKVNKVQQGDSLTITIVPKTGFVVQRVNVDKVSQGAITEYTDRKSVV